MFRPGTTAPEAGDVSTARVEMMHIARTVPVADVEVAIGQHRTVGGMVLREIRVSGAHCLRTDLPQLLPVCAAHAKHLAGAIGDPVAVLAVLADDVEAMGARKAMLPGAKQRAPAVIGQQIVMGIVGKQHDTAAAIHADAVAIPYRILRRVQLSPVPQGAVTKPALTQYLVVGAACRYTTSSGSRRNCSCRGQGQRAAQERSARADSRFQADPPRARRWRQPLNIRHHSRCV